MYIRVRYTARFVLSVGMYKLAWTHSSGIKTMIASPTPPTYFSPTYRNGALFIRVVNASLQYHVRGECLNMFIADANIESYFSYKKK